MRTRLSFLRNNILSGVLIFILVCAPIATILTPRTTSAQWAVFDGANVTQTTVSAVKNTVTAAMTSLTSAAAGALKLKELTLDGIAFALAKLVLQEIVRSTVQWINSGFKGSPMFIQDLGQFMTNIADDVAGRVIYGSDLAFLCRPVDIRIALQFYYTQTKRNTPAQCTLSGVVKNVQAFANGNFSQGGWAGMMHLSLTPSDTLLGSLFSAEASLNRSIGAAQEQKKATLDWGKGFLSKEVCDEVDVAGPSLPGAAAPTANKNCKIVTPGDTIAQQLTFDLSSGKQTLIEADEINEVISALLSQLAKQALSGAQGLLGLSKSGAAGGGYAGGGGGGFPTSDYCTSMSYLDQMGDPNCNEAAGGSEINTNLVSEAIANEELFQDVQRGIASSSDQVRAKVTAANLVCTADQELYSSVEQANNAATVVANNALSASALALRNTANAKVTASIADVNSFIALQDEYDLATDIADKNALMAEIASTVSPSDSLHVEETLAAEGIRAQIASLSSQVANCPPPEEGLGSEPGPSATLPSSGLPVDWPRDYLLDEDDWSASPLVKEAAPSAPLSLAHASYELASPLHLAQATAAELCPARFPKFPNPSPLSTNFSGAISRLKNDALTKPIEQSYIYVEHGGSGKLHFIESGTALTVCMNYGDVREALKLNPSRLVWLHTHQRAHVTGPVPPSIADMMFYAETDSKWGIPSTVEVMAVDAENTWAFKGSPNYETAWDSVNQRLALLATPQFVAAARQAMSELSPSIDVTLRAFISIQRTVDRAVTNEFGAPTQTIAQQVKTMPAYKIGYELETKSVQSGLTAAQLSTSLSLHRSLGGTITRNPL